MDEVDNVLRKIDVNRKYENIEEVTETKLFIKQLHDRQLEIARIIKSVHDQIDVLDENLTGYDEKQIRDMWKIFARPIRI